MPDILVIEDNLEVRENLAEILQLSGYNVDTAENGKLGVEKAMLNKPDLILCDVMMPELDGFGVLRILNTKPETNSIPFVFLTALSEKTDFRKGMNLGADDYITKPFDDSELLDVVERRLEKSKRLKQNFETSQQGFNEFLAEAKASAALEEVSHLHEPRSFRKKDVIYEEGQLPQRVYLVQSGKIKLFKTNEDGKEYILRICKEGDFFGHIAMIADSAYTESAAALEGSELGVLPKEDFLKLLNADRYVSARLVKMLANDVAEQEEMLLNMAYNSVRRKVADALVRLYDANPERAGGPIAALRDDLAAMAGTAKETLIRTLTEFKSERMIDTDGSDISILDINKLRNLPW